MKSKGLLYSLYLNGSLIKNKIYCIYFYIYISRSKDNENGFMQINMQKKHREEDAEEKANTNKIIKKIMYKTTRATETRI